MSALILIILLTTIGLYFGLIWKNQEQEISIPFATNISKEVQEKPRNTIKGRTDEVRRLQQILMRRTKNNPLLIGEPGVGKTAIVEGLAEFINYQESAPQLKNKIIFELNTTAFFADTANRGDLESRANKLVSALKKQPDAILFIDEVHQLVQSSGSEGSLNIVDMLKPGLARGELQIIGATTLKEYQKYIKPDTALERRFQPITVNEPSPEEAFEILTHIKHDLEAHHEVKIEDSALKSAVELSNKYIKNRFLPDKAIDLIDEASAKVSIDCHEESRLHTNILDYACRGKQGVVTAKDVQEIIDQILAERA